MSMSDTTDTQRYAVWFDPRTTSQMSEKSAKHWLVQEICLKFLHLESFWTLWSMNNKQQIDEASTSQYIHLRIFTKTPAPADRENLTALRRPRPITRTGQICYRYRTRPDWSRVSVETPGHSEQLDLILIDLQIVQWLLNDRRARQRSLVLHRVTAIAHVDFRYRTRNTANAQICLTEKQSV